MKNGYQQNDKLREERFVAWLITQTNSHGSFYLERVSRQYARYLRTQPPKLIIPMSQEERNVYACHTVECFERLYKCFISAPNYQEVNLHGHQSFSAGLSAYRRYLRHIDENGEPEMQVQDTATDSAKLYNKIKPMNKVEPQRVDFTHPEYCTWCDPVSCFVEGKDFSGGNWRDLLVAITESFLSEKLKATELYETSLYQSGEFSFIQKDKPKYSSRQLSNGFWINVNLSVKDIVLTIGRLCLFCGVHLEDVDIRYAPKQSMGGYKSVTRTDNSARFAEQVVRDEFRVWLVDNNPEWSRETINMYCSNAYYLYNNDRGITFEEALTADDGLQRAYDAIEHFFTANPTQTNNASGSARGYVRSLRMLKEFIGEHRPELLPQNRNTANPTPTVPYELIEMLNRDYSSGFRFETTYIHLLSNAAGIDVDDKMQAALKRIMFRRDDGIYFLLDNVADVATRKDIVDFADVYLEEYGCFEITEFYGLYANKVNTVCIRNADDFESFYEQIGKSVVRCVQAPYIGNRIARYSDGNVWGTFNEIAAKIVAVISKEYYGSCNEEDLHIKFCAFSTDLLGKIIKQCAADDLICVKINGSVCYQTYEALGLPESFSALLAEIVEHMDEIGLIINRDALHTALSLKLGVNFMSEFNLPDWDTFQRLIATFYKAEPRRAWKHYIFGEVTC